MAVDRKQHYQLSINTFLTGTRGSFDFVHWDFKSFEATLVNDISREFISDAFLRYFSPAISCFLAVLKMLKYGSD